MKTFISISIGIAMGLFPFRNSQLQEIRMFELITTGATYWFPGGRALKLVKNGVNITNSTNPLIVIKNVRLTVLDCCAPPPVRLAAHCIGAGAVIAVSMASSNPVTIGSAIYFISEIYENC